MLQVIQHFKSGLTEVVEAPAPALRRGHVLVRTHVSLVAAGTERMLVEFGRASLLDKARQQPDKIAVVLEKMRTDGILAMVDAITDKLDQPVPLGYCNVGTVIEVGAGLLDFNVGDRVASNGPHAEIVRVPAKLCAQVPHSVPDEMAAFAVTGSIALQSVRLLAPTLGETIVVTGLGLVGLLAVEILRANGCRVLGIDLDPARLELARGLGAAVIDAAHQEAVTEAMALTAGRGVDGVLIAASTDSSQPVVDAARMSRQRGRIVLVGVTGLELSRADFYAKELTFQVSCSYGPGRYDPQYEQQGHDYPIGFVRWTEQRNLGAILDLMAAGSLRTDRFITHRIPIARAADGYDALLKDRRALGILLTYDTTGIPDRHLGARTVILKAGKPAADGRPACSFIGAGNYASRVLMPAFVKGRARLRAVITSGSVQGVHAARKFGFEQVSTNTDELLQDAESSIVVVATRHDSHSRYVLSALRAGKHVYCEKPLCLSLTELTEIDNEIGARPNQLLMVGFNRRFSPFVQKAVALLSTLREPTTMVMTVNAGAVPRTHWTQRREEGGGRFVGEGCHFIDLLRYIAGAPVVRWTAVGSGRASENLDPSERATVTLEFADGSVGTVHYMANGHRGFPKERLEVFGGGRILQLDDFRLLRGWGWPGFTGIRAWRHNKGQDPCVAAFLAATQGVAPPPIPREELLEVSRISIEAQEALDH